jgi:alkylation response protein AidB-like acyl-CoA dehydrogenase
MDLAFSAEDRAFQREVRDWIAENYDDDLRRMMSQSKNGYLNKTGQVKWQKKLASRGWATVNWPVEFGGPDFTPSQAYIYNMEMSLAGVPTASPMGLKMVAPVIMAFGTDEQKAQHLPPIINSDIWWCQGYSEPGSGSDLASLQMKAERDGDDYILNGSKIWTTHAQWADWMFCLVRTDNSGKPQNGISFLLLKMDTPGILVKALPTLDGPADNEQEINQVFFDNVRVPVANRIGEEGQGWAVAKRLMQLARSNNTPAALVRRVYQRARNAALATEDLEPGLMARLITAEVELTAFEQTELNLLPGGRLRDGDATSPSVLKLIGSELHQRVAELAMEIAGTARGIALEPFRDEDGQLADGARATAKHFATRAASIYSGSSETQRNVIAQALSPTTR